MDKDEQCVDCKYLKLTMPDLSRGICARYPKSQGVGTDYGCGEFVEKKAKDETNAVLGG